MTVDASPIKPARGRRLARRLVRRIDAARRRIVPASKLLLSSEEFQWELAVLGLSGRRFGPEDYAEALGRHLGISIVIHVIPDAYYPEFSRRLALSGRLAELRFWDNPPGAAILVLGSLPPLVLTLTIFHELGHLASGDHLIEPDDALQTERVSGSSVSCASLRPGKRLARRLPLANEDLREQEAHLRASYALVTGCLGSASPYAQRMYDAL